VELALSKLDNDYQETTYRHNQLVAACIKSAREELDEAFEQLYAENLQRAFNLSGIAWLHTDFGRQLIDAEAIEHIPWESKAKGLLTSLEEEIKTLRTEASHVSERK
jgi:hypothetical protein